MIEARRRNLNRGYMKLRVWQDALEYYTRTCESFVPMLENLRRIYWQQTACVDSIHRNIAEGYCRRSIGEYLQFLNVALGSVGESVSALHAYRNANQIEEAVFDELDALAYKIENSLKKLIEKLQEKRYTNDLDDSFVISESNAAYEE